MKWLHTSVQCTWRAGTHSSDEGGQAVGKPRVRLAEEQRRPFFSQSYSGESPRLLCLILWRIGNTRRRCLENALLIGTIVFV
jgi:hypothetical protein